MPNYVFIKKYFRLIYNILLRFLLVFLRGAHLVPYLLFTIKIILLFNSFYFGYLYEKTKVFTFSVKQNKKPPIFLLSFSKNIFKSSLRKSPSLMGVARLTYNFKGLYYCGRRSPSVSRVFKSFRTLYTLTEVDEEKWSVQKIKLLFMQDKSKPF